MRDGSQSLLRSERFRVTTQDAPYGKYYDEISNLVAQGVKPTPSKEQALEDQLARDLRHAQSKSLTPG